MSNASEPAPDPKETMRIWSPGWATSRVRGESDDGRARIGISNHRHEQTRLNLFHRKSELRGEALRELRVGLMEDRPLVILGGCAAGFHQMRGGFGAMFEVSGFARESHAVFGIPLIFAPPEIGRIGDIGIRGVDDRQRFFRRTDDYAPPPAPAVYSSASPGLPCAVSMPMAIAECPMPEPTKPIAATKASVPALHANSQSAACVLGTAPIASATTVEVGLTA